MSPATDAHCPFKGNAARLAAQRAGRVQKCKGMAACFHKPSDQPHTMSSGSPGCSVLVEPLMTVQDQRETLTYCLDPDSGAVEMAEEVTEKKGGLMRMVLLGCGICFEERASSRTPWNAHQCPDVATAQGARR